jgi:hypothetical protein
MSWLSQFLGLDAQGEQQTAINRQQETAKSQMQWTQGQYGDVQSRLYGAMDEYGAAANREAAYTESLGGTLDTYGNEMKTEFQGALKDIYAEGRNQAASSGLIGGFQEGQNTAPQIAALGRSYATNLAGIKGNIASQKVALGQQASQLRLSPYAMKNQTYGNMSNALLGLYGQTGGAYTQSRGNYAEPANPLGNILGAVGGILGGAGSFMTGGKSVGLF